MKLITVAGPPSCGKTSVVAKACGHLMAAGEPCAVVKFDCLQSRDGDLYRAAGTPVSVVFSGGLCPDHFFATNLEEAFAWAAGTGAGCFVIETAGLCNRCSPHINGLTGQGCKDLAAIMARAPDLETVTDMKLRFPMPAAVCSYCLSETRIGGRYQKGNVKKARFGDRDAA
jgi:hypothetical protein